MMQSRELIEDIIIAELKGLCISCRHASSCPFRKNSGKDVIQCEMFERGQEHPEEMATLQGLCKTCDFAAGCKLPGRSSVVWRCASYQ